MEWLRSSLTIRPPRILRYDPNGNLLSVQDANGNTTTYTYNNHDLVASRTDPLQRTESYSYDTNENLSSFTDRKGQVATTSAFLFLNPRFQPTIRMSLTTSQVLRQPPEVI